MGVNKWLFAVIFLQHHSVNTLVYVISCTGDDFYGLITTIQFVNFINIVVTLVADLKVANSFRLLRENENSKAYAHELVLTICLSYIIGMNKDPFNLVNASGLNCLNSPLDFGFPFQYLFSAFKIYSHHYKMLTLFRQSNHNNSSTIIANSIYVSFKGHSIETLFLIQINDNRN